MRRLPFLVLIVLSVSAPPARSDDADPWTQSIAASVGEGMLRNFEGRYDAAEAIWAELRQAHPAHPAGALFAVETLYWRQVYDIYERRFDAAIETAGREALKLAKDWLAAHPENARAQLFVGQAEMQLGRIDGVLRNYYAAGRHAERARGYLERALELDPGLVDARYWLGMYSYYASTLPSRLHWLDWLWFIPEPDGPGGLRTLREVSETGDVHRTSASFLLMNIFTYFERDYVEATALARTLNAMFPENTLVHFELLRLLHYQRQYDAVIEEARRLESHPARDPLDRGRVIMAQVWRARAMRDSGHPGEAAAILARIDVSDDAIPLWGRGWIHLVQGQLALADGRVDEALAELEKAAELRATARRAGRLASREIERIRNRSPLMTDERAGI